MDMLNDFHFSERMLCGDEKCSQSQPTAIKQLQEKMSLQYQSCLSQFECKLKSIRWRMSQTLNEVLIKREDPEVEEVGGDEHERVGGKRHSQIESQEQRQKS